MSEGVDTSRGEITHLWACYLERAQQAREHPYPHQQPPEPHAEWYERTANALRALLDRAEKAEAERDALGGKLHMIVSHATMGGTDGTGMSVNDISVKITALRNELYAHTKAAGFKAGQEEMRERAAEKCKWHSDRLVEGIRALPLTDTPE